MTAVLNTLVNGHAYDFSSIKLTSSIIGAPPLIERFTSINYEHSVDVGELRGRGSKVLATTRGEYSANGSMTLYLEDWQLLRTGLIGVPVPPGGFMEKRFQIICAYAEIGSSIITDTLRGCRVIKVGKGYSRGNEPLMVDIDLHVMEVLEDAMPAIIDGSLLFSP